MTVINMIGKTTKDSKSYKPKRLAVLSDQEHEARSVNSCNSSNIYEFGQRSETKDNQVAAEQTNKVKRSKLLVYCVLIVAILGSLSVYMYINRTEESNFEQRFEDDTQKVSIITLFEQFFFPISFCVFCVRRCHSSICVVA
jgi:hypothetical protein